MDIEQRVSKLEETLSKEGKIERVERIGIRLGMLIIVLLTLLLIILTKCSEVLHVITTMFDASP
jgi:hypothetical protein